jgi:poly(A) polymerase
MSTSTSPAETRDLRDEPEPVVHARRIPEEDIDADAVKVIRRLVKAEHEAYLVGGGVRDLLLGRQPKDFDVATSARPNEVRALFRNCRIIGRRFRLAHILYGGGKVIETATFRRDPHEDDGREDVLIKNDNVFGDPHEDAIRRDFTINGLFYDVEREEVIDYVGGMPDLEKRLIRTIGDPLVRLREDPIRILRAIKFAARLDLTLEGSLERAMLEHRADIQRSAPPRVHEEILRLLRGGAAERSIYLSWDMGVLAYILPEVTAHLDDGDHAADMLWGRLRAIDRLRAEGVTPSDSVLFTALLYGPIMEMISGVKDSSKAFELFFEDVTKRLSVPRRMKDRVRSILSLQRRIANGKTQDLERREYYADACMFRRIELEARGEPVPDSVVLASVPRPVRRRDEARHR